MDACPDVEIASGPSQIRDHANDGAWDGRGDAWDNRDDDAWDNRDDAWDNHNHAWDNHDSHINKDSCQFTFFSFLSIHHMTQEKR